ncbi:MAG: hypothetical protein AAF430_08715 [Myxococcota bacterium]
MAIRPFVFGARLRDKGRTVRVRSQEKNPKRYVVEDSAKGRPTRRRDHPSLQGALRDAARSWRGRLN